MEKRRMLALAAMVVTILTVSPFPAFGDDSTDTRPGESDPMKANQLVLFRDDELLMVVKDNAGNRLDLRAFAPDNGDLTPWDEKESNVRVQEGRMDVGQIAIASGRISEPAAQDDVVLAFYDEKSSAYQVEIYRSTQRIAWKTIPETAGTHSSVGVAVGDLDRLVDENGFYHDEIVFVRNHSVGTSFKLLVDVLDQDLHTLGSYEVPFGGDALHVAAVIGDFDGNGSLEFATGQTGASTGYQIDVFQLTWDTNHNPSLTWGSTNSFTFYETPNGMRMAAGDFNGDGTDDVAAAGNPDHFDLFASDDNFKLSFKKSVGFSLPNGSSIHNASLSMVPGLFRFDIPNRWGIGRRQLAICQGRQQKTSEGLIRVFSVGDDWTVEKIGEKSFDASGFGFTSHLTAGNFVGNQKVNGDENTSPLMDIAFSHLVNKSDTLYVTPKLTIAGLRDGTLKEIYTWTGTSFSGGNQGPDDLLTALVAYDRDGDSVLLGPPVHLIIEDHLDFSAVIAEPPKHIDYMKDITGAYGVLNVSRKGGQPVAGEPTFYTGYVDENDTEITTTDKSETAQGYGVQVSAEAEADFGIPVLGGVKVDVEAGVSKSYESNKGRWNRSYSSEEMGKELTADNDDYLVYREKTIDIWRYPVINEKNVQTEDGKEGQLYVQMSFPSDEKTCNIEGTAVEWYQPAHENGNILSYPWDKYMIDQNIDNITKTSEQKFVTGGDEATFDISWTNAGTVETEVSTEKKLAIDGSISVSKEVLDAKTMLAVKTSLDQSWSSMKTSKTTNSKSYGITIYKTPLLANYSYAFTPYVYENSVMGVLQAGYTVNPFSTDAANWWKSNYDDLPDLALNLPFRWYSPDDHYVDWDFNKGGLNLKMMKGLFFLDSDGKPFGYSIPENSGDPDIPIEQRAVTVRARIYNYSFVDVSDVDVRIEAQASKDNDNWGSRSEVGKVTIGIIPGFGNTSNDPNWQYAEVTFDTTGRGGYYYRFSVFVDPDDKIEEITGHNSGETYDNNTGWFGIPLYVQEADSVGSPIPRGDVVIDEVSASDEMPVDGEAVLISARVEAVGGDRRHVIVHFYDGHPDKGGKLFDVELVPYLKESHPYMVKVPYHTGNKVGAHDLCVTAKDADEQVVTVTVLEKPWRDKIIKLLGR